MRELSPVVSSVIQPIEFISTNNSECIILEFGGISLRDVLQQNGAFKNNISEFIDIAIQITDSLRILLHLNTLSNPNQDKFTIITSFIAT